ncbi:MAG: DNA polymerase III subunit delta' [Alphaproteobacteria bacterium]|nr:MAG: DNA polymerase III subunit delta' [Alphaproteobacteria bacterium]
MGREPTIPEPPHPRMTPHLEGHEAAERTLLAALDGGRLHHAWLFTGPRGIGKATLAYRFARHLLATGGEAGDSLFGTAALARENLELAVDHPVFQRVAAGSESNLFVLERGLDPRRGTMRGEIVVDDVRALGRFFAHTAAGEGWRVAIVDSADEMNRSAANALLKILEEPPEKGILLLVSHTPGRLLPTIRSRCRRLALHPLADETVAGILALHGIDLPAEDLSMLVTLARGAPGRAIRLATADGLALYREILHLLGGLPRLDRVAVHRLAGELAGKAAEERYRVFVDLFLDCIARLIRGAALGGGGAQPAAEARLAARLATVQPLDRWVELWEKMGRLVSRAEAVHLDRKQVVLSLFGELESAATGRLAV